MYYPMLHNILGLYSNNNRYCCTDCNVYLYKRLPFNEEWSCSWKTHIICYTQLKNCLHAHDDRNDSYSIDHVFVTLTIK